MSNSMLDLMKLVADTKVDSQVFVYFENTAGKIYKIGRKDPELKEYSWIVVDPIEIEPIMSGAKNIDEYKVSYDPAEKEYKLVERLSTANDYIYNLLHEIPTVRTSQEEKYKVDLVLSQNINETCWKIKISPDIQHVFSQDGAYLNKNINFSITSKHDPNILYKQLKVDFSDLAIHGYVVLPFSDDFEFRGENVSIFTSKVFEDYIYEVVE